MAARTFAVWLEQQRHRGDEVGLIARQIEAMEGWARAVVAPITWRSRIVEAGTTGKLGLSFVRAVDEWQALRRGVLNFRDWVMSQAHRGDAVANLAAAAGTHPELDAKLYDVHWCERQSRREPQTERRRAFATALKEWRGYAGGNSSTSISPK